MFIYQKWDREQKLCRMTALKLVKRVLLKNGFTLIELLVVVLIIGILAAIALPQYTKAVEKSRAVEAVTAVRALMTAQKVFYLTNGQWSDDFSNLDVQYQSFSGKRVLTDNFIYNMHMPVNSGAFHIDANRRDAQWDYSITGVLSLANAFDTVTCQAIKTGEKANEICKTIGQHDPSIILDSRYNYYTLN